MHVEACGHVQIDEKVGHVKELFIREAKAKQPAEDAANKPPAPAAPAKKDTKSGADPSGAGHDPNEMAVKMTLEDCRKIISMVDWGRTCEPRPPPACF
jgi:hypothetical protein